MWRQPHNNLKTYYLPPTTHNLSSDRYGSTCDANHTITVMGRIEADTALESWLFGFQPCSGQGQFTLLHLKDDCSDFSPVWDRGSLPYPAYHKYQKLELTSFQHSVERLQNKSTIFKYTTVGSKIKITLQWARCKTEATQRHSREGINRHAPLSRTFAERLKKRSVIRKRQKSGLTLFEK